LPRILLIEDLTKGPVPHGSNILVEFDPASQWLNASLTIAAGWVKDGGKVSYIANSQSPDEIRSQLRKLGLAVEELERTDRLWITDGYSASIGQKSKERFAVESLKAADLSLWMGKEATHEPPAPEFLVMADNNSVLDRFNAEKNWIELYLTRMVPMARPRQITQLLPFMSGVHSAWAYKQLEAAVDGIVDFKLDETTDPAQNLIRIRNLRNVGFDGRWHELNIAENFEVMLRE
jgi:KaiC/GvpD/RAD55 family RecA-like ATPase